MIPVTFFRSSSLNTWVNCQQSYFIEYVLGRPTTANIKTDMGTVTHKALEILAVVKKAFQDSGNQTVSIEDDCIGNISVDWDDFLKEEVLTDKCIANINYSRRNKQIYMDQIKVRAGSVRRGREFVNSIIKRCYEYYTGKFDHKTWKRPSTLRDIANFTWMAVEYDNGKFDPRLRNIVEPERQFDFELDFDWSKYHYELPEGELNGNLRLKGTIDLITDVDGTYEIIDWKTGQRKNWVTGQKKTLKRLKSDLQLLFYNYVIQKLYPDVENNVMTIFFIRDGGPFTLDFSDKDVQKTEDKIRSIMDEILTCEQPKLLDENREKGLCKYCDFAKETTGGQTYCSKIEDMIMLEGIDKVIENETVEGHRIGKYHQPG